jgi:hypothetical protein
MLITGEYKGVDLYRLLQKLITRCLCIAVRLIQLYFLGSAARNSGPVPVSVDNWCTNDGYRAGNCVELVGIAIDQVTEQHT